MSPSTLARLGPPLTALLVGAPILLGLLFTLLPAFGYLPVLGGTALSLDPFRRLAAEPGIGRAAFLSLATGLLASLLATLVTLFFLASSAGTRTLQAAARLLPPFLAVPHAAAAFGFLFLLAPSGFLARLVSPELTGWETPPDILLVNDPLGLSLALGLAAKEALFLLLVSLAALPQTDFSRRTRLAASLSYGRIAGFVLGVWPTLYRQIRLPVLAVVAYSTSVVDVAAILGPSTPPTLAVRLVQWSGDPDLRFRFLAASGALLQLGVSAAAIALWMLGEQLGRIGREAVATRGYRLTQDGILHTIAIAMQSTVFLCSLLGFLTLVLWSFAGFWSFPDAFPTAFRLSTWTNTLPRLLDPLLQAALIGLLSATLSLLLALLCLHREDDRGRPGRGLGMLLSLPLLVPQAAFLFGLQLFQLSAGLRPDLATVALIHTVFVLPYAMLALRGPWTAFDRRYEQVALSLGRGPWTVLLRVRLALLLPALASAFAISFAVSVGLYLPTLLIGAGRVATVTTEAVALASGSDRRVIGAYALAQTLLPALLFAVASFAPRLLSRPARG